jgi:hypothetical protein
VSVSLLRIRAHSLDLIETGSTSPHMLKEQRELRSIWAHDESRESIVTGTAGTLRIGKVPPQRTFERVREILFCWHERACEVKSDCACHEQNPTVCDPCRLKSFVSYPKG